MRIRQPELETSIYDVKTVLYANHDQLVLAGTISDTAEKPAGRMIYEKFITQMYQPSGNGAKLGNKIRAQKCSRAGDLLHVLNKPAQLQNKAAVAFAYTHYPVEIYFASYACSVDLRVPGCFVRGRAGSSRIPQRPSGWSCLLASGTVYWRRVGSSHMLSTPSRGHY
ncbi:proline transporter 1 [Dorcoceras hygrometricum]|uniref:Proline transporter 1 n=1 Tax=Dorcoceras hygrometricum TaxID=472368 RepID=A0A2Z7AXJ0_9LAMI|nr:proline transporter 1 [Dorcoceras hygrometricum]